MIGRFAIWVAVAASAVPLGGCGLPPAIALAGYAADGLSYGMTGKSTTDLALSATIDRDCSLLRAAYDEPVCRKSDKNRRDEKTARDAAMTAYAASSDEVAPGVVLLGADADPEELVQVAWLPPDDGADEIAQPGTQAAEAHEMHEAVPAPALAAPERVMPTPLIPPMPPRAVAPVAARPIPAVPVAARPIPAAPGAWMLVLGSYRDAVEARSAARRFLAFRPMVVDAKVDGRVWRRVVSGPYDSVQLASARRRAREQGAQDAWGARLCPGAPEPRCVARAAITRPLARP